MAIEMTILDRLLNNPSGTEEDSNSQGDVKSIYNHSLVLIGTIKTIEIGKIRCCCSVMCVKFMGADRSVLT